MIERLKVFVGGVFKESKKKRFEGGRLVVYAFEKAIGFEEPNIESVESRAKKDECVGFVGDGFIIGFVFECSVEMGKKGEVSATGSAGGDEFMGVDSQLVGIFSKMPQGAFAIGDLIARFWEFGDFFETESGE